MTISYLDVRSLKYITSEVPMPFSGKMRFSIVLTPVDDGTRLSVRFAQPACANPIASFALRTLAGSQSKKLRALWVSGLERLEALVCENANPAPPSAALTAAEIGAAARGLAG